MNLFIKKRTVISVLITVIAIIITNKYWLIFNPMHVSLDIKGNAICNIEVLLNKKDNNEFKKVKSEIVEVNLNNQNNIDFYVKKSRFPKRVKFIISNLKTNQNITLSNIKIGKYKIENLNNFIIEGAVSSVKDNELLLKPNNGIITLAYPETLHARCPIKFDFKIFIIILILSYLLTYNIYIYYQYKKNQK